MLTVAFTGHRPNKLGGYGDTPESRRYTEVIAQLLRSEKVEQAISGMALGVDQWAFEACLRVGVPVVAAVPFEGQESRWPEASQRKYRELLEQASEVVIVTPGPYMPWKMQTRNEWMVDHCDQLWAVWNGSEGGTANCVRYAWKKGKPVLNLFSTL